MGMIKEEDEDEPSQIEDKIESKPYSFLFMELLKDLKRKGIKFTVETAFICLLHLANEK